MKTTVVVKTKKMKRKKPSQKQKEAKDSKNAKFDGFLIDTFIQNPGFEIISRTIFQYLDLKSFHRCRLVSKTWKCFVDEDKHLKNVQLKKFTLKYCKGFKGRTSFHDACHKGSAHIVKLFLENQNHMNFNAQDDDGWTPLHIACEFKNASVVEYLLNYGLDVTKSKGHILHLAAKNKDSKVLQTVIESKPLQNVDEMVTNMCGFNVLHYAAANPHSQKSLAYLLDNSKKFNLNINSLTNDGLNLFHAACEKGTEKTVNFITQQFEIEHWFQVASIFTNQRLYKNC